MNRRGYCKAALASLAKQTAKLSIQEPDRPRPTTVQSAHTEKYDVNKMVTITESRNRVEHGSRDFILTESKIRPSEKPDTGYIEAKAAATTANSPEPAEHSYSYTGSHSERSSEITGFQFSPYTHCPYIRGRGCHVGAGTRFGTYQRYLRYTLRVLRIKPRLGRTGINWTHAYTDDRRS